MAILRHATPELAPFFVGVACRDSSTNFTLFISEMKLNAKMTSNVLICYNYKLTVPFFALNEAQFDLKLVKIRQIWI